MASLFPSGLKGLSDSKFQGKKGTVAKIVGVDYRTTPGLIKVHQKLAKNSGSTVTELCKARVACSDGSTLWFSSESGKIWREVSGVWSLVYTLAIGAWDLLTAAYEQKTADVSAKATNLIQFVSGTSTRDGTRMLVFELLSNEVHEYHLSTPWDISSATFDSTYSHNSEVTSSRTGFIRRDGLKMYVFSASAVFQYTMSSEWDVSTSSYDSKTFSFSSQTTDITGAWFSVDGDKLFVKGGTAPGTIYQYTLATPWDVSTASYDSVSFALTSGGTVSFGSLSMSEDGTRAYVTYNQSGSTAFPVIRQYLLATPWSFASVSLERSIYFRRSIFSNPSSITFDASGRRAFAACNAITVLNEESQSLTLSGGHIYQFSLAAGTEEVKGLDAIQHSAFNSDSSAHAVFEENDNVFWSTEFYLFKVAVSDLASFSNVQAVGRFKNGDDTYHPLALANTILFAGDASVIASYEQDIFTQETNLNLPRTERITALKNFDIDLLVGTKFNNQNKARVLRWDTTSESWSAEDAVRENAINAFIEDDNYVYVQAGEYGRLYFYNGEKLETLKRIPGDWTPTAKGVVYANAVDFHLGIPLFGLSNLTGNPALQGVYGLGRFSRDYSQSLSLDFPISSGNFSGVTIGAILVRDFDLFVAWQDASGSGVDKLDWSNKYASAHLETTMLSTSELRNVFKTLARFYVAYASLPTGTDVAMSYKKKHEANFSSLTTIKDEKLSLIQSSKTVPEIANLQLRLDFTTSSNASPELEDIGIDWVGKKRTI